MIFLYICMLVEVTLVDLVTQQVVKYVRLDNAGVLIVYWLEETLHSIIFYWSCINSICDWQIPPSKVNLTTIKSAIKGNISCIIKAHADGE